MNVLKSLLIVGIVSVLAACGSSPQQKKDTAEARHTEEKTKTLKQYKQCVQRAKQDTAKLEACEYLLKAIDNTPTPAGS